ncbi:hypothetical protein ACTQ89_000303 [Klebsiella pneumoniae]|nr:hypothetical protein [Klebsiella pneumoniae]
MTDITELALLVSKAKASVFTLEYISQFEPADIDSDDVDLRFEVDGRDTGTNVSIVDECGQAAKVIGTLVEALEKAQQAPIMPLGLHPDTQKLVADFCTALAEKLYKAQLKYGYDTDWKQDGWPSQCQAHFHQHIAKGDPRDVAAYCAFMWWHGWSTKPAEGLESRTVTVKLPDYRNTYKSPLADEVEHQVRLALELLSSAAGIKVEAE